MSIYIMAILKIIGLIAEWTPIVSEIVKIFGGHKAQRRAKKLERAAAAVIKGVEQYANDNPKPVGIGVKTYIQSRAQSNGAEPILNELVKKYTNQ